jgi:trans-2,3-dihydro-3-hydroxyanthranilate isomerase
MKYQFTLVDVFTDEPFMGNQLAVFTKPSGLSTSEMQAIAKEFNFSEVTFVFPPRTEDADYWVRIFTPHEELPMAGHPTIGTAFVLSSRGKKRRTRLVFEEGVGPIPVSIELRNGRPNWIGMSQLAPKFGPTFGRRDEIAEMLSIDKEALVANLPIEAVSCGVPFLFVPVKDLHSVQHIRFNLEVWERLLKGKPFSNVFAFTTETEHKDAFIHSRMFAPDLGVHEDPATGSASGPVGCYLVKHGILEPSPEAQFVSEQGIEIGRPSKIRVSIGVDPQGKITKVEVSGRCRMVGEGFIEF